ncbi:hypothetical protein [Serratia sp. NPDC087055]|uniref:hypothetical protein n=1 Tax=Serratia sp. NPDC087055 TaxID=3364516 RepID=UPI00384D57B4
MSNVIQLGKGPLVLLDLRAFRLPGNIFSVDAAATAQVLAGRTDSDGMDGME